MSGIAIVIKGADFSEMNLGKVTILEDVAVEAISINGNTDVRGVSRYTIGYTPTQTNQQGVTWSIEEGAQFATIDENGRLSVLFGASNSSVVIKATSIYDNNVTATKQINVTYVKLPTVITVNGSGNVAALSALYTATFQPEDTTEREVVWSVIDGGEDVTIDQNGKLTIGPNAQGIKVKVRATSSADSAIYGEKEVMCTYWIGDANPIVYNLSNCIASTMPTGIEDDGEATIVLAPSAGYSMPRNVSVEGATIVSYNSQTGTLIINEPTGAVMITANGINAASEVVFVDAEVERICIENWDANADGKITYGELAAVSDVGQIFRGNTSIVSLDDFENFTGNKNKLSNYEFSGCSMQTIKLPSQINYIGYNAFKGCPNLEYINLSNVTTLESGAFENCTALANVTFGNGLTSINGSFNNCDSLTEAIIPEGCTSLGNNAFHHCDNLTRVVLPSTMTSIAKTAFAQCYMLQSINIPAGVTYINGIFESAGSAAGANGGITLTCESETPATFASPDSNPFGWNAKIKQIRVPASSLSTYKAASGWSQFANIIVTDS